MYGDEYLGVREYVNRSWMYDITVLINEAFQVMNFMSWLVSDIRWPSKIKVFGILGGGEQGVCLVLKAECIQVLRGNLIMIGMRILIINFGCLVVPSWDVYICIVFVNGICGGGYV